MLEIDDAPSRGARETDARGAGRAGDGRRGAAGESGTCTVGLWRDRTDLPD